MKTVAIVGGGPTRKLVPWSDPYIDIWQMNEAASVSGAAFLHLGNGGRTPLAFFGNHPRALVRPRQGALVGGNHPPPALRGMVREGRLDVTLFARSAAGRTQAELEVLGVHVRTVCADLSDSSEQTYSRITAAALDVDLSIVINCVGVTVHRLYADVPPATLRRLLSVNVSTTSILTHATLPLLLNHAAKTGCRGALLNVGSIVGRFYWPGTQLYGACKAFMKPVGPQRHLVPPHSRCRTASPGR